MSSNNANPDLESFRQQWISDLRSRDAPAPPASQTHSGPRTRSPTSRRHKPSASIGKAPVDDDDEHEDVPTPSFDAPKQSGRTITDSGESDEPKPLVSALDHYEEAMEKEAQGNMGDSLHLYRQAYRMDQGVDKRYREKYFPAGHVSKPKMQPTGDTSTEAPAFTSLAPSIVPKQAPEGPALAVPIGDLITSFSSLQIEPLAPDVEGAEAPPCPIASVPDEILVHILEDVASVDVAAFARLSLVCKRLAYLASHEQRVWRRVCVGDKFGFPGMHHHWQKAIEWTALEGDFFEVKGDALSGDDEPSSPKFLSREEIRRRQHADKLALTLSLVPSAFPTWRAMFRSRPRIRFNGCYISTVNYVRTGVMSTNQATWGGAPIHIVTYYRYLRFFRDGTCISLLTTSEPADVVHHVTKDLLQSHRETPASSYLPSAMMRHALKGRWRLSSVLAEDGEDDIVGSSASQAPTEGDLYIETEGVGPKYTFRMDLSLRSAGKGARNNKLVWRGFYSYNKLTDDWGEFMLKNDKPFFFSRVKSYGFGE